MTASRHLRSAPGTGLIDDSPSGPPDDERERQQDIHPEIEAFARWFADWWLRRGNQQQAQEEEDERAAA
jgi:hypothetical protein